MKNPLQQYQSNTRQYLDSAERVVWPDPSIEYFLSRYAGQISLEDRATILDVTSRLIAFYQVDEGQRHRLPAAHIYPTASAKDYIYEQTILEYPLRAELCKLFDTIAHRRGRPRFEMPVDKRGFIHLKQQTCLI